MKERLELLIEKNRDKLKFIENEITSLNMKYMEILDEDENNIHLKKIETEINYLERQQDSIVRSLMDKKRQLRELNSNE